MRNKIQRLVTIFLSLSVIMSMSLTATFAAEVQQNETNPYQYYYNGYDYNVSPHYLYDSTYGVNQWLMIFRLDKDNYYSNRTSYSYNETDRLKDGVLTYCCDVSTGLSSTKYANILYKRVNLEDSTYYDDVTAGKIRAILTYGYWPGESWNIAKAQSEANTWLKANGYQGKISDLTNAEALSATQGAIWNAANNMNFNYNYEKYTNGLIYDAAYLDSSYKATTVDMNNVNYKEGKRDTTENNINLFIQYLMGQDAKSPTKVLFADDHFVSSRLVTANSNGADSYEVTLYFKLSGDIGNDDELTLTAEIGNNVLQYKLGKNSTIVKEESGAYTGYYKITFSNVTADEMSGSISMSISGTQTADDIYLYQPQTSSTSADAVQKASQNLVGKASGTTTVYAEQQIELGNVEIELFKYDDNGNEGTVTESIPLEGVMFDLYGENEAGQKKLFTEGLTTDINGTIKVANLPTAYSYYFKETKALSGYTYDEDKWFEVVEGKVMVGNKFETNKQKTAKK